MSGVALVLRLAGVALLSSAVFSAAYALAEIRPSPMQARGIRGLKRVRAVEGHPVLRHAEPLLRWLGPRTAPLLNDRTVRSLDRSLTLAGDPLGLEPAEFVAWCLVTSAGSGLAGGAVSLLLERGWLYAAVGAAAGLLWPHLRLQLARQERQSRIQDGLPHAVDLLALGMSAGLDFPAALHQVVEKSSHPNDPLIEEFGFMLQMLDVGKTRKEVLLAFADRAPSDAVQEFVAALVHAEERGNPVASVLLTQAEVSRQKRSVRAEERAARAGVKLLVPMALLMAAVLLLIAAPMAFELGHAFGDR
jgi:tight adherence protein C